MKHSGGGLEELVACFGCGMGQENQHSNEEIYHRTEQANHCQTLNETEIQKLTQKKMSHRTQMFALIK